MEHNHGPDNKYGCNWACLLLCILYALGIGAVMFFV